MYRREFLVLLAELSSGRMPRQSRSRPSLEFPQSASFGTPEAPKRKRILLLLVAAFRDLGYIEGRTINFIHRFPAEQPERFRALARDLVDRKVDLLVAVTAQGASAIKETSTSIPVVFVVVGDPVGMGLADSLSSPGNNFTGDVINATRLSGKHVALLREAVPQASLIALFVDRSAEAQNERAIAAYTKAAENAGLSLKIIQVSSPEDNIEGAFSTARETRVDAAVAINPMFYNETRTFWCSSLAGENP